MASKSNVDVAIILCLFKLINKNLGEYEFDGEKINFEIVKDFMKIQLKDNKLT